MKAYRVAWKRIGDDARTEMFSSLHDAEVTARALDTGAFPGWYGPLEWYRVEVADIEWHVVEAFGGVCGDGSPVDPSAPYPAVECDSAVRAEEGLTG